jgi:hypothetical protein
VRRSEQTCFLGKYNPWLGAAFSANDLTIVGRLSMAIESTPNLEHAFVPEEDTMTAVFASREKARAAISALPSVGISADEVQLVTGKDHPPGDLESPGLKQDSPGVEAFDEILHVFTETFSDDDKAYVEFDRVLAAGGALVSFAMAGRAERRSEIASRLRSLGARAIYYWGALATEQL